MSVDESLLLREFNHRCANDLQLAITLLNLESRRSQSSEARESLKNAMERIAVVARARASLNSLSLNNLEHALEKVCEALRSYSEPLGINISLSVDTCRQNLCHEKVVVTALVVNELATNAIKHAFEQAETGKINIKVQASEGKFTRVTVDDDGLPFPEVRSRDGSGMGIDLISRLAESVDATLVPPSGGSKIFLLKVPVDQET
jgi:two-component sensor histidine kinase